MQLPQQQLLEGEPTFEAAGRPRTLVIACGAIAREVLAVIELNGWTHVTVRCLPGKLHSTPGKIPAAVDAKLREARERYDEIFVAYADCGTAGALDRVLDEHGVERLPGAHCYGFFAGNDAWQEMHDEEPGTFYLTDFLARHFDSLVWRGLGLDRHPELLPDYFGNYTRLVYLVYLTDFLARHFDSLVWRGLGLDRHPELLPDYFGNYTRLVYLAQTDDEGLTERARAAADRLGLAYVRIRTGYGELLPALTSFVEKTGRGAG